MKKCVLVSDSFKETLSSLQITEIAKNVIKDYQLVSIPVADGGEGTVDAFCTALNTEKIYVETTDATNRPIKAYYTISKDIAIIEMASCCGLALTPNSSPLYTTTYGLGKLFIDAYQKGIKKFYLGLGGSSTNDCGCGLACSLGCQFFDENNKSFIPVGETLKDIKRVDTSKILDIEIIAMCDVTNPLYGPKGAAYVFAPQKGANQEDVYILDMGLRSLASLLNNGYEKKEGAGAAGGFGYGILSFFNGKLEKGAKTVLDLCNYDEIIKDADLIITGEGKFDSQSLDGKLVSEVLKRSEGKNVVLLVGISEIDSNKYHIYETNKEHLPFEMVKGNAYKDYERTLIELLEKEG